MAANELTPEAIKRKKHADYMRVYVASNPEQRQKAIERAADWRVENLARERANKKEWRTNNPELNRLARARHRAKDHKFGERPAGRISIMVTDAKGRAKRRGLEFEGAVLAALKADPPVECPCCHVKLDYALTNPETGKRDFGRPRNASPSMDRFENSKGYTVQNTAIICYRCNSLKSNATVEELKAVIAYMQSRG